MSTSAGDLVVNVSTDIASLYTGMQQAADVVSRSAKEMAGQFSDLDGRIGGVVSSLKTLGEAAVLGFSIKGLSDMVTGAIDAEAHLQDLAVRVGTTASQLSALIPAATLSGTSMDQVAQASARLDKALSASGPKSQHAADALKAIGLSASDIPRLLANPTQAIVEISQHLNQYADSGTKVAAVQALMGRGAAENLPFFKQLGDQLDVVSTRTDAQVAAAHNLETQWNALGLRADELKASIASGIVPALTDVLKAFTDATSGPDGLAAKIKVLASDGTLGVWALETARVLAVVAESFMFLGKTIVLLGNDIRLLVVDAEIGMDALVALNRVLTDPLLKKDSTNAAINLLRETEAERVQILADGAAAEKSLLDKSLTQFSESLTQQLAVARASRDAFNSLNAAQQDWFNRAKSPTAEGGGPAPLPSVGGIGDNSKATEFTNALLELQKQAAAASAELDDLFSGTKITQAEKYLAELKANTAVWDTFNAKQKESIEIAATIAKWREQDVANANAQVAAQGALLKATQAYNAAIAASSIAIANAGATSQLQAIAFAQENIKRQYDRGLIDFKSYYDQQTAYQKQAIDVQVAAEQIGIDALQSEFVKALNQLSVAQALNPQLVKDAAAKVVEAQTNVENTSTKLAVALSHLNDTTAKSAEIDKGYVEAQHSANSAIESSVKAINDQIDRQTIANDAIGLTASQTHLLIAAKLDEKAAYESLHNGVQSYIDDLHAQADAQRKLAGTLFTGEQLTKSLDAWKSTLQSAAAEGATFIENFVTHGASAFQTLWADFKAWALKAFAEIAAQQIIISIAGNFGSTATNAANSLFGPGGSQANPLLNLLTGGKGIGGGNLLNSFETSSVGQALGLSSVPAVSATLEGFGGGTAAAFGPEAGSLGAEFLAPTVTPSLEAIGGAAAAAAPVVAGFGTALASAIPYAAIAVAAYEVVSSLLPARGGPKQGGSANDTGVGGLNFYPGETTAAGNTSAQSLLATTTQSFNAQLQALGGTAAAQFALGFDTDPKGTAGNRVSAGATVGGQQVFKQLDVSAGTDSAGLQAALSLEAQRAVLAALQASSLPAYLTHLLDTVSAMAGSSADITALLTTAQTVKTLTDAFDKLMNPTQVTAFTTALNGIDFTKSSDAVKSVADAAFTILDPAMVSVVDAFTGTGAATATFVATLASISADTTKFSDSFRATIVTALADGTQATADKVLAFVAILNTFGDSMPDVTAHLQTLSATDIPAFIDALGGAAAALNAFNYQNQNFLTSAQRTAAASTELTADFASLGVAVPTSHAAFLAFLNTITDPATLAKVMSWEPLFVAVFGTADQAQAALANFNTTLGQTAAVANQIVTGVGSIIKQANDLSNTLLGQFSTLAGQSTGNFGEKLSIQIGLINDAVKNTSPASFTSQLAFDVYIGNLNASSAQLSDELGRFTVLSAQYDAARAEQLVALQDWDAQQQQILSKTPDPTSALAALQTIFQQKWDAIVNGTSTAVAALQQTLDDFIKSIQQTAQGTGGNQGQQAALQLALTAPKLTSLQAQYATLDPNSALAQSMLADITKLQTVNDGFATELAHFTVYTAQYGETVANQLVTLENSYTTWKASVGDNAAALAVLSDIFNEQWQKIIDSTKSGVSNTISQFQQIADYLKGLQVSPDLSPLTPLDQLVQAKQAYDAELALAQGGNSKALGDVTQFADTFLKLERGAYASSQTYVDAFNGVTGQLGALAGVLPTGQPLPTTDPATSIASALPVDGSKIMSSADADKIVATLIDTITAQSNADTSAAADAAATTNALLLRLLQAVETAPAR